MVKTISRLSLIIVLFLFALFAYKGLITKPWEGDSLAYHIPIAKTILNGEFLNPVNDGYGLEFYPGASEALLAIFILLRIPLSLFNLLSWILLFFLAKRLGITLGLKKDLAQIFSVGVVCLPSVLRLITTQTIDIWLAVFFVASLILLETPEKKIPYFLKLGFTLGMLVGTKYSGVLFALLLIIFYSKKLLPHLNVKRVISFALPFSLFGLFWYVRNYILTGNPIYPATFLIFQGLENFYLLNWQPWKTLLFYDNGLPLMIQALISEFLLWSLLLFFPLFVLLKKAQSVAPMAARKLAFLGFINFIIYLFLPSWPENIVSDLRYTYPAFVPLMFSAFLTAQENRKDAFISLLAFLNIIAVLPQLDYYPKLFALTIIFIMLIYPKIELSFG